MHHVTIVRDAGHTLDSPYESIHDGSIRGMHGMIHWSAQTSLPVVKLDFLVKLVFGLGSA